MSDELRKCPFCGSRAQVAGDSLIVCALENGDCAIRRYGFTRDEWNRRAPSELSPEVRAVIEAAKNVDANDGMDEGWKLRYALRALAALPPDSEKGKEPKK